MKAVIFALRSFGRELRSGEVLVLLAAVALAVSALTAVGFLTDRIGKAVARQANEVLAADLRLRSHGADTSSDDFTVSVRQFRRQIGRQVAIFLPFLGDLVIQGVDTLHGPTLTGFGFGYQTEQPGITDDIPG